MKKHWSESAAEKIARKVNGLIPQNCLKTLHLCFLNEYKKYLVPYEPILNICTEKYDLIKQGL